MTPALHAAYTPSRNSPMRPASEPMLTIAPAFRAIMPSSTARVQLIMPQRLSWISRSHSSRVFSTKSRSIVQPTLFTSTSTPPRRPFTSFTMAWTESQAVTSVRTAVAEAAPSFCASAATFPACASSMSAIVTCARSPANARLRARPMFDPPPVTITLLPARFSSIECLLASRRPGAGGRVRLHEIERRQNREAAVDDDRLAGEKAPRVRGDERGDVLAGAGPAHRRERDDPLDRLGVLAADAALDVELRRVGLDQSGAHPVHGDPERSQLHRQHPHEALERGLGGAERAVAGHRLLAVDAGDGDDPAGPAPHERDRGLDRGHERLHRDGERALEVVALPLERGPEGRRGGVGHEDVHPPEDLADPRERGRALRGLAEVERERERAPAQRSEERRVGKE